MKYRIALWASVGFLIAGVWALYYARVNKDNPIEPIVYTLSRLTCPIVFAGDYFHFGISIYWFFVANVATYALVGLIAETLRRRLNHAK